MGLAVWMCVCLAAMQACTAAQGQTTITDETLALDLTNAACSAADATGNPIVEVTCVIAQVAEDGTLAISKILVAVPAAQVSAFIANAPGARLVTRKMLFPLVSPTTKAH